MSQLELADRTLILHRFPQMREESPLQAWDAADEYLLQQTLPEGPILVFNDSFGALTCALNPRPRLLAQPAGDAAKPAPQST